MTTVDIPDGWTLGRRTPESFEHVEKHPFLAGIAAVEVELALPPWERIIIKVITMPVLVSIRR